MPSIDSAIRALADRLVEPSELAKARAELETRLWVELDTVDGKLARVTLTSSRFGNVSKTQVAAGVLAIGAAAVAIGKQLDDAFDTIAVGTGASGTQLDELKESRSCSSQL